MKRVLKRLSFEKLSIAHKLVLINITVVVAALAFALMCFVVSQRSQNRDVFVDHLKVQSTLMAAGLGVAVQAKDFTLINTLLQAYRNDPNVEQAIVFDDGNKILSFYQRVGDTLSDADHHFLSEGRLLWAGKKRPSFMMTTDGMYVFEPLRVNDNSVGELFVYSTPKHLVFYKSQTFWLVFSVFLIAFTISFFIIARMVGWVTEPIQRLWNAVKLVGHDGDYSIRVTNTTHDELGQLSDAFNHMLKVIGERNSELSKHQIRLESEVQERTHELRATNESLENTVAALQQANRAIRVSEESKRIAEANAQSKAFFLANMSHELRTPMNGVLGMLSLLQTTTLDEEQQDYVGVAYESGHVLLELINNVLDLSKIEEDKLTLENIGFNLRENIEEVISILAEPAHRKGLDLALDWQPLCNHRVLGDPTRFKQIIFNLIGNAIKFTEVGHVTISYRIKESLGGKKCFRFDIRDTGVGLKPEVKEVIFEKFSQADISTTRQYGGSGLGLALCKKLTQLMSGSIGVESELGAGSTFWFEVSFDVPIELIADNVVDIEQEVLVYEPSLVTANSLRSYFGDLGLKADICTEIESFNSCINDKRYAALLISVSLGSDVLACWIDKIEKKRTVPVGAIFLLGTHFQRQKLNIDHRKNYPFLSKPLRMDRLAKAMNVVFDSGQIIPEALNRDSNIVAFNRQKLLVVEDNEVNQKVARTILEKMGYDVMSAEHGAAALKMLQSERFDLIFMDCQMPILDGYQAARRIRQDEHKLLVQSHIPIIAMTAHALAGDKDQCLRAGMDDYMVKPFKTEELKTVLDRWLQN